MANELKDGNNGATYPWVSIPSSMGDDYIVYVNDISKPSSIKGFRNGSNWYNSDGVQVEDPKEIRGAAGIAPWLEKPSDKKVKRVISSHTNIPCPSKVI